MEGASREVDSGIVEELEKIGLWRTPTAPVMEEAEEEEEEEL